MNRLSQFIVSSMLIVVISLQTGCCSKCGKPFCFDRCADIPSGAIPQPLGTYGCGWQNAHASEADLHKLTIYRSEWISNTTALGPFGQRHLSDLIPMMSQTGLPIVIEQSDNPELDQQRKSHIIQLLTQAGFEGEGDWVVVGFAEAEGGYGFEAPRNAASFLIGNQGNSRGGGGGRSNVGGRNSSVSFGF